MMRFDARINKASVIPNALDTNIYTKVPVIRNDKFIKIIVMSRLFKRKGIDYLLEILYIICKMFPQVQFLISGEGPKKPLLEHLINIKKIKD